MMIIIMSDGRECDGDDQKIDKLKHHDDYDGYDWGSRSSSS